MVGNSGNKIYQTWERPNREALYLLLLRSRSTGHGLDLGFVHCMRESSLSLSTSWHVDVSCFEGRQRGENKSYIVTQ